MVKDQENGKPPITYREFQVLEYMASGTRNESIAEELFIAPDTVRTHRRNIRRKLEIKETSSRRVLIYQQELERLRPFFASSSSSETN
mgnify:CR=1 FL=1